MKLEFGLKDVLNFKKEKELGTIELLELDKVERLKEGDTEGAADLDIMISRFKVEKMKSETAGVIKGAAIIGGAWLLVGIGRRFED